MAANRWTNSIWKQVAYSYMWVGIDNWVGIDDWVGIDNRVGIDNWLDRMRMNAILIGWY